MTVSDLGAAVLDSSGRLCSVEQSAGVVLRCHVTRSWDPCHKHLPIHYVFDSELTLGDAVHSEVFYCCQTLLRTPALNSITSRGVANLS